MHSGWLAWLLTPTSELLMQPPQVRLPLCKGHSAGVPPLTTSKPGVNPRFAMAALCDWGATTPRFKLYKPLHIAHELGVLATLRQTPTSRHVDSSTGETSFPTD